VHKSNKLLKLNRTTQYLRTSGCAEVGPSHTNSKCFRAPITRKPYPLEKKCPVQTLTHYAKVSSGSGIMALRLKGGA